MGATAHHVTSSKPEVRARIDALQDAMLQHDQVPIGVSQFFCNGVYLRQIVIPAGVVLTGRIHKFPCLSIIASGEVEVITEDDAFRVCGPHVYESPAGTKRCLRAITETTWITAHPYDGDPADVDTMADHFTVDTFAQLEAFQRALLENKP